MTRLAAIALTLGFAGTAVLAQDPRNDLHVVVLRTAAKPDVRATANLPTALRGNPVYWRQVRAQGAVLYQLCIGFFATSGEAEKARQQLLPAFPQARIGTASAREREMAGRSKPAAPSSQPPAVAKSPPDVPQSVPEGAEQLMAEGRAAITREDYAAAVAAFAKLLSLPENALTRNALEFRGLAHERRGDVARARTDYENYLMRYPDGDDATRVRQRLTNLRPAPRNVPLRAATRSPDGSQTLYFGSLSQYYYHGNSKIDSLQQQVAGNTLDRTTLSVTDQSSLITNVDLSARFIDREHDNRLVFRDTYSRNFLEGRNSVNRLNAAYYEYRYKPADLSARLGRQPGYGSGVLGRFDGATVGTGVASHMRLNAVAGQPVPYSTGLDYKQRFFGLNTDIGPFGRSWSSNVFAIRQTVDGIRDREAVGIDVRYAAPQGSVFTMIDYDTLFRELNAATLQGNWIAPSKTAVSVMADYRMSPTLQTSTAVLGEGTTSIRTLLDTYSEQELRARARALTAKTAMAYAGITTPVAKTWQLGMDIRVARISHTDGTNNVPGMPSTGHIYTLTGQAIGTSVFAQRDVNVLSLSRVTSEAYNGVAARANSRWLFGTAWSFDIALLGYRQVNQNGSNMDRISPTLRLGTQMRNRVTLEAEVGMEATTTRSATVEEKLLRNYFSVGYRWDF